MVEIGILFIIIAELLIYGCITKSILVIPKIHYNDHINVLNDICKYKLYADIGRKVCLCELVDVDIHMNTAVVKLASGSTINIKFDKLVSLPSL